MRWLWTDDLARLLVEASETAPDEVGEWLARPVAISVAEDMEPLEVARRILIDEEAAA